MVCGVMRFAVLGSGSQGNAAVVETGGIRLLIDAGLSAKQLSLRLRAVGVEPASLNGILLTHEHGDHVRGLRIFLKQFPVPVFTTAATARVVREAGIDGGTWKYFEAGQDFTVAGLSVETFAIQHDAVDPVGFVLGNGVRRFDGLFVEANYDEALLQADTKRPWSIKQRISSRHGHLSNTQVTELIREIAHPALGRVVLGHLSSDCNTPEIILGSLRECLLEMGHGHVGLHCAVQHEPSEWFHF